MKTFSNSQEEKEESSSGEQAGHSGEKTSSANFVQTIQCDVTLKVNETIKVILRKMNPNDWEIKLPKSEKLGRVHFSAHMNCRKKYECVDDNFF